MKNRKPMYRQTGGVLPGEAAQQAFEQRIGTGTPFTPTTGNYEEDLKSILNWSADPRNIPQYYTDQTVASFDPVQQQAQQGLIGAAGQQDALTQQLIGDYQSQLDPTSALNRQIASEASRAAGETFYGAGTPGSARGQIASNLAANEAVRRSREGALSNLGAQRGQLRGGADILGEVGGARQQLAQDVINEDIKRFNYAQLSPQQQQDRIISILTGLEGIKQGHFQAPTQDRSRGIFSGLATDFARQAGSNIFGDILGGIFGNEGGKVGYYQLGGEVDPMMDQGMPMEDPMMTPGIPQDPMMDDPMMAGGAPMDPMMGGGIMGGPTPIETQEPMMDDPMMDMGFELEPMSEIDKVEDAVEMLVATTGAPLTVTRKTVKAKAKKGG